MFNNCNSATNGEKLFYNKIKKNISVIFDVGCRHDSEFLDFEGECHYFEPVKEFIENLSKQSNRNKKSHFNNFGLGNETKDLYYYPEYQSFYNRTISCGASDESNKIILKIKKVEDYISDNNISSIDFVKIDTEGCEFDVIKGFGKHLMKINIIQFEYGGTFLDNKVKLKDLIEYLKFLDFHSFSYLTPEGTKIITDFTDHYQYCNIVCLNKNLSEFPY